MAFLDGVQFYQAFFKKPAQQEIRTRATKSGSWNNQIRTRATLRKARKEPKEMDDETNRCKKSSKNSRETERREKGKKKDKEREGLGTGIVNCDRMHVLTFIKSLPPNGQVA